VVGYHDPEVISQFSNEIAVIKRPGGVAMHGDNRSAAALVEIVEPKVIELEPVAFERIEVIWDLSHMLFSDSRQRIATTAARP
jgi:hypothetical protein